jgi:metallo-beta-lactamase class B
MAKMFPAAAGLAALLLAGGADAPTHAPGEVPAVWREPIKPFEIVDGIYYVGTRGLSAYLITSKDGAILLEGTLPENAKLIEHNIEELGFKLSDVKLLISDHAHYDHVGGLAELKRDTGAPFAASAQDKWALEHGVPRGDTDYGVRTFPPVAVDRTVADGETVDVGGIALTAHVTPGHTPGCTAWSMTATDHGRPLKLLFLCSITVAGNLLVGNKAYPEIVTEFRQTFQRLDKMQADVVLTSHPEVADVLGRETRRAAGDADAFVDPGALAKIVGSAHDAFETALSAAEHAADEEKSRAKSPTP